MFFCITATITNHYSPIYPSVVGVCSTFLLNVPLFINLWYSMSLLLAKHSNDLSKNRRKKSILDFLLDSLSHS